jgi:hypothetical protein
MQANVTCYWPCVQGGWILRFAFVFCVEETSEPKSMYTLFEFSISDAFSLNNFFFTRSASYLLFQPFRIALLSNDHINLSIHPDFNLWVLPRRFCSMSAFVIFMRCLKRPARPYGYKLSFLVGRPLQCNLYTRSPQEEVYLEAATFNYFSRTLTRVLISLLPVLCSR